ncbi:MAG: acetoin utilization protein AcuC, partial [Bacteroidota bacterium]
MLIYSPAYLDYDFGAGHPFSPVRQRMVLSLLSAWGVELRVAEPEPVDDLDLLLVHSEEFVRAVQGASELSWVPGIKRFGLDTPDVPCFPGMDEACRVLVGGAVLGAKFILSGQQSRMLHLGGGLHHALPGRASGFCVYNDLSVAIRHFQEAGMRVAYIDIDVHHGDGVQWTHYDEPDVLTISLHEDGRFLFPGTGGVDERGEGDGIGTCINVPLAPYTGDESYLQAFERVVPPALERFRPDVLVVQAGADAHSFDPLAHLDVSTRLYAELHRRLYQLADAYTGGKILVTLGGGYNPDATSRVWAMLVARHLGVTPLDAIPEPWRKRWTESTGTVLSRTLHDEDEAGDGTLEATEI